MRFFSDFLGRRGLGLQGPSSPEWTPWIMTSLTGTAMFEPKCLDESQTWKIAFSMLRACGSRPLKPSRFCPGPLFLETAVWGSRWDLLTRWVRSQCPQEQPYLLPPKPPVLSFLLLATVDAFTAPLSPSQLLPILPLKLQFRFSSTNFLPAPCFPSCTKAQPDGPSFPRLLLP